METVLKAISDWIKSLLTAAIMSNLSGLFDDVNTQVGNIAQQVGTKPSSFEPRVFAMIEALSRNVVLPIAGVILTFIACYELIQMITEHNNMAQFEPALILKWVTLPLSLHGVICKKDGSTVTVNIGDKPNDPVVGVSDLLIHLSGEQMGKKASEVIKGESLDVLIGSIPGPQKDEDDKDIKERVKANILTILSQEYGVDEDDFLSAEIEVVPAGEARDYGLDRSMIMGYGHDDRVCAYPSYRAMLEIEGAPEYTSVCLLVDKEEIGSVGASGMQSRFFENCVAEVMNLAGDYSGLAVRRALKNSKVLSSDVSAAFDPNYPSVMEKKNSAYFGKGLVFNKYTGARGKSGSNDANAEYVARLRNIMDTADVSFQTAELGKVDEGGGGTIAYILANYDMNVIDSGVPVLNMHAPWEIISKVDLYEAFRGYIAFLKEA